MLIEEQNKKGGLLGKKLEGGRRRSGLELAALRREGPRADRQGQGGRDLRLLDLGVAQIGAAGLQGAELDPLLSRAIRGRGERAERLLHRRRAEPAGDPGRRLPRPRKRSVQRWVLAGTDYVYPRTTNKILEAYLKAKGVKAEDIMINYTPFGHSDWQTIVADIKKFGSAGKKTAVVSTINGDANVPFYKELGNQGVKATDIPVVPSRSARRNSPASTPRRSSATSPPGTTSRASNRPRTPNSSRSGRPSRRTTSASPTTRWKRTSSASTCGSRRSRRPAPPIPTR